MEWIVAHGAIGIFRANDNLGARPPRRRQIPHNLDGRHGPLWWKIPQFG